MVQAGFTLRYVSWIYIALVAMRSFVERSSVTNCVSYSERVTVRRCWRPFYLSRVSLKSPAYGTDLAFLVERYMTSKAETYLQIPIDIKLASHTGPNLHPD